MAEKTPSFTVSDRRKFTLEGELREETAATEEESPAQPIASKPAAPEQPAAESKPGPRLVTTAPAASEEATGPEARLDDEELIPEPTAQESAEQHAAYRQSSEDLDSMLRQANPGMGPSGPVTMEHIIQSMYLSAVVAMGAPTEPGQKPRIDIIGARQSIDMLGVLQEKTKGNLMEKEQRLLQNALFELRMMFLDITNAIAKQAQNPPPRGAR
ncbi:MAG: DUF1844 domain-containing protein [Silvibacterium sp.]|nr:DUF1844 domain-containing protein [Silvibacterium sp.]